MKQGQNIENSQISGLNDLNRVKLAQFRFKKG